MPLTPIIPPDPIEPNVDYRYDGCYQSMVLVLLQRLIDASGGDTTKLQEILDELVELNGKVATEATLEASRVLLASLNSKDFATETTLASIKSQTDLLNFTDNKLRTTGEDGGGGNGVVGLKDIEGNQINPTKLETQENALLFIKRTENVLLSLLEQQKRTNKYLKKIVSNE
jgi:hypothetical protein